MRQVGLNRDSEGSTLDQGQQYSQAKRSIYSWGAFTNAFKISNWLPTELESQQNLNPSPTSAQTKSARRLAMHKDGIPEQESNYRSLVTPEHRASRSGGRFGKIQHL